MQCHQKVYLVAVGFFTFMSARNVKRFIVINAEGVVVLIVAQKAGKRLVNVGKERRIKL